LVQLRNLDRTM